VPLEWLHRFKTNLDGAIHNKGYVPRAPGSGKKSFDKLALHDLGESATELRTALTGRANRPGREPWQSEYSNALSTSATNIRDEHALEAGRNVFSDKSVFKDFETIKRFYRNDDVDSLYDPPGRGLATSSEKLNFKIGVEQAIKEKLENSQRIKRDRPISPDSLFSPKERAIVNLSLDNNQKSIDALNRRIERESRLGSSKLKLAAVKADSDDSVEAQLEKLSRGGRSFYKSYVAFGGNPISAGALNAGMMDAINMIGNISGTSKKKEALMEVLLDTDPRAVRMRLDRVDDLIEDIRLGRDKDSLALARQLRKQVLTLHRLQEHN
jgi:hypothetical protein